MYKAVRGGVQDVAVKIMHEADDEQLAQFEKVFSMQMTWISSWVLFWQKNLQCWCLLPCLLPPNCMRRGQCCEVSPQR